MDELRCLVVYSTVIVISYANFIEQCDCVGFRKRHMTPGRPGPVTDKVSEKGIGWIEYKTRNNLK